MADQLKILLAFFLEGFIVGILFDLFRVTRKCYKTPNFLIYIEDVLFWLLTGFLTLTVIYVFTYGQMRLYMILTLYHTVDLTGVPNGDTILLISVLV